VGLRSWLLRGEAWEKRTLTPADLPWTSQVPFNVGGPLPGGTVSPETALTLSSVYSANRLIAQSVATLPLKTFRRTGSDGRQPMPSLPQLFQQLQTDGQLVPWLHRCVTSLTLRGNAYGLIVSRDGFQFPTAVDWLDPGSVHEDMRPGRTGWLYNGREVPNEDIVHIPLFAIPGRRCGLSPIGSFARTLGVGLQAQAYASDWFGAGGFPPGTFKNTQKTVPQQESDAIKARLTSAIRQRQPLVYGSDWDYNPISVPPEEAQFVQTVKMTTTKTRWDVNQIRVAMGAASIDEIREQEDQPPLPNGQGQTYGPQPVSQPQPPPPQLNPGNNGAAPPIRRIQ
jgi:phage portal protein BeeE